MDGSTSGLLVGQRFGKYELLALLAVGGTAEIYLARIGGEAGFEKYVVCKCMLDHLAEQPDFVRMFLDEARLGAQLDHSNIVQTLELGEHEGRYYMVMEYLSGVSLSTMAKLAQERVPGGMPIELTLFLAAQACSGLQYAHDRATPDGRALDIIHRDISPQNLVISFEGVLKIVDFGIAKAAMRETHTRSGTIKGKFAYMSPEQALSQELDRRTDLFALGIIIHELLTGQRLFKRESTYATYQAIVNGEVTPPSATNPQVEPALDAVVMKALAYTKENRFGNAQEMGEALLGVLHKRGRSVGASDVARFFEQHFQEELQIHSVRMRELINGGRSVMPADISWHPNGDLKSNSVSMQPDEEAATIDADVGPVAPPPDASQPRGRQPQPSGRTAPRAARTRYRVVTPASRRSRAARRARARVAAGRAARGPAARGRRSRSPSASGASRHSRAARRGRRRRGSRAIRGARRPAGSRRRSTR